MTAHTEGGIAQVRAIEALLQAGDVPFILHEHVAVGTIEQAHQLVPHLTLNLIKTLVFEVSGGARIILLGVDCNAQVDYKRISAAVGCSRRALRLVPGPRVEAELGFEVGGVGPFRLSANIEVILDARFSFAEQVKVGGGTRTHTFELAFGDLVRLGDAKLAAVSKEAPT